MTHRRIDEWCTLRKGAVVETEDNKTEASSGQAHVPSKA